MAEKRKKIVDNDFIVTCLQYEFYKNPRDARSAHKNLCEMLVSKEIREDVIDATPLLKGLEDVDRDEEGSSESQESDSIEIMDEEEEEWAEEEEDDDEQPIDTEPERDSLKRSAEDVEDREENPAKKLKTSDSLNADPTADSSHQSTSQEPSQRPSHSSGSTDSAPPADSDGEYGQDRTIRGSIKCNVYGITVRTVVEIFELFKDSDVVKEVKMERMTLLELKSFAYTWLRFYSESWKSKKNPKIRRYKCVFNELTTIVDFYKVKICYSNSKSEESSRKFEYWDDDDGCLFWFDDNVRIIKGSSYEELAALEFMESTTYMKKLELLKFDIAEKNKWSPDIYPSNGFWHTIKAQSVTLNKVPKIPVFSTRIFWMKVFQYRPIRDEPYKLKLVDKKKIEEIAIRFWSDDYSFTDRPTVYTFEHLRYIDQWRNAKCLDVVDKAINQWVFSLDQWEQIKFWSHKYEEPRVWNSTQVLDLY